MMPPDVYDLMTARMDRLEDKLDELIARVSIHPPCPSPGSCVELAKRVTYVERQLIKLERWQAALMAIIAMVGFILTPFLVIFGPAIRFKLGIP
jgi:hypothetical protein